MRSQSPGYTGTKMRVFVRNKTSSYVQSEQAVKLLRRRKGEGEDDDIPCRSEEDAIRSRPNDIIVPGGY